MAASYDEITAAIVARLKADTSITDLLASRTIGATTNKANSIFTGMLPDKMSLPCIVMEDFGPRPAVNDLHENPMLVAVMDIDIRVIGEADALYAIQAEVDEAMESANLGQTSIADSSHWTFTDVETAGGWLPSFLPRGVTFDGNAQNPEVRRKSFAVMAAVK